MNDGNRLLDEFAKLLTDTAGLAQGVRREFETLLKVEADKFLSGMDLVSREEFDVVKEMASRVRLENEELRSRILELESQLGIKPARKSAKKSPKKMTSDKKVKSRSGSVSGRRPKK